MATSSVDRTIKIWDLRNGYRELFNCKVGHGAASLSFSQRGLLAASMGDIVQVCARLRRLLMRSMYSMRSLCIVKYGLNLCTQCWVRIRFFCKGAATLSNRKLLQSCSQKYFSLFATRQLLKMFKNYPTVSFEDFWRCQANHDDAVCTHW